MPPAEKGSYRFDPKGIVDLRNRLGIAQFEMARMLGVPANTLSRWETGKATPDAHSLAAIYSFAQDRGLSPSFFRHFVAGHRTRLVVVLDFTDLGVSALKVRDMDSYLMEELERIAPSTDHEIFKAFARPDQVMGIAELKKLKWRVRIDESNQHEAIIQQVKSDCGQDPDDTILVICAKDGNYGGLVAEMQGWGVMVQVMGAHGATQRLRETVDIEQWTQWPKVFPIVVQYPSAVEWLAQQSR